MMVYGQPRPGSIKVVIDNVKPVRRGTYKLVIDKPKPVHTLRNYTIVIEKVK